MRYLFPVPILVAACVEYRARRFDEDVHPVDTDGQPPSRVEEPCNAVDDDDDFLVDEGSPDADANGRFDCYECGLVPAPAEAVSGETACAIEPIPSADPWNIEVMWAYRRDDGSGCRVSSVADIDADGIAEVMCVGWTLQVLDGASGRLEWTYEDVDRFAPTTIVDMEGDGALEVVTLDPDGHMLVLDATGGLLWSTAADWVGQTGSGEMTMFLAIADLAGDGSTSALTHHAVVDLRDQFVRSLEEDADDVASYVPMEVVVHDIDADGMPDILFGAGCYDSATRFLSWSVADQFDTSDAVPTPVMLQADGDDEGEVVWLGVERVVATDADGTVLGTVEIGADIEYSMGCAGDLLGDGSMAVVLTGRQAVRALAADLGTIWSVDATDWSTYTACAVFDFNLDGADEVVALDEVSIRVLDGRTGDTVFEFEEARNTVADTPIVVDLDGDGSVDLLAPNPWTHNLGVIAFRNVNRDWPPGTNMWVGESWSGTQLWPDGSVPKHPAAPWLEHRIWRGQSEYLVTGRDLRPEFADACVAEVDAPSAEVHLSVRFANLGPQDARPGTPVAVYAVGSAGERTLLEVVRFEDEVPSGWTSATEDVALTRADVANGLVVVAGDDGGGGLPSDDCDATNNEVTWSLP